MAVLPEGWDGFVEPGLDEDGDDVVFSPCLDPGDFDLDALDASSVTALQAQITGPFDGTDLFGPPEASVEARVFQSEQIAADAFATLEKVLGTEEGRQCLAEQLLAELAGGAPEDAEFSISVEGIDVPQAGVAGRIILNLAQSGFSVSFYIDLVASRSGACTVYAVFLSFDGPFPTDVLEAVFTAAATA